MNPNHAPLTTRLVPLLALVLAACSGGARPAVKRVAVLPKGTSHEFWKAVEKGARAADLELPDLEIVWKGPTGEGDAAAQIALFESFVAERYDGICLAPLDGLALEAPVRAALGRGVPVVIFDSGLSSNDVPIVSFVATDNRKGGQLAGEEMVRRLEGRGRVAVLRYQVGSESTTQREAGFLEVVARSPNLRVVSSDRYAGPDESKAIEVSESLLATLGEQINGVFCSNESTVSGFLTALQRDPRKLAGHVIVIGFDSSPRIVQALSDGSLAATVLQDPVRMGNLAVKTLHAKLTGRPVDARVDTGQALATKENMADPRVQALLDPLGAGR
jgi:ribose transport system substrate-binding protein